MIKPRDDKGSTVTETEGSWARFVDHIYMQKELWRRNATAHTEGVANNAVDPTDTTDHWRKYWTRGQQTRPDEPTER
jgi:hypothetical protein